MNLLGRLHSIQTDVNQAITELEQIVGGQARSVSNTATRRSRARHGNNNVTQMPQGQKRSRHLTAAARRKMSLAAKKRWAEKKAA